MLTSRCVPVRNATQPHEIPSKNDAATNTPEPIDDGWMTCGAKCQAANPTVGHNQPSHGFRGQSVMYTPRHRISSNRALATATPRIVPSMAGVALPISGMNRVVMAPAAGQASFRGASRDREVGTRGG
jgi:hypothetical protein